MATLPSMGSQKTFGGDHDGAGGDEARPAASSQPAGDVDEDAGEREKIWMNPETDARGDDEPQREVEHGADGASESHEGRVPAIICSGVVG